METEFLKDLQFGEYTIRDVPHITLSEPTTTGELYIREILVDVNVSKIYKYMVRNNIKVGDYQLLQHEVD